jgi:hypothetical protein
MSEDRGTNGGNSPNSSHKKHEKLYHWVYVAGYIIISSAINFAFLWPESHLLALLALAALFSLPASYELTVLGISGARVVGVVAFLFAAAGGAYLMIGPIPPPEPWRGWLQPADEPTPPNACDRWPIEKEMTVLLGNAAFFVTKNFLATRQDRFVPLSICGTAAMTVERSPNGMKINTTIHDTAGELLGNIVNNGYDIPKDDRLIVEHSGDLSSLVVHDAKGEELLYIRYFNPHLMRLRGTFVCHSGQPVIVINNEAIVITGPIVLDSGGTIRPSRLPATCFGGDNLTGVAIGN